MAGNSIVIIKIPITTKDGYSIAEFDKEKFEKEKKLRLIARISFTINENEVTLVYEAGAQTNAGSLAAAFG